MAQKQFSLVAVLKSDVSRFNAGMKSASGSMKGFGNMAKSIGGALGGLAAFAGISAGIANAVTKIKDFEAALSSLSAITGATGKDLKFYEQAAISTSKKTLQSATDIVKAYEKVGSASPILLKNKEALAKVAEQAIILSEASGGQLGLDGAIDAVTASMNQFGISGEESARIINTLAAGSLEGSAPVATIAEAMKNVGTVAKDSNMSLEQTVAALEVLGEKQIFGAEAGTKLRGALLKMKEAGIGYASGQFNLNDAIEEANKKLNTYGTQLEKDAYKSKLFGAENITVGSILLANKDKYNQLTAAVTGTTVALDQQRIQNDNLKGDLAKLSTTWDSFVVSLNSGSGAISKSIRFVTQAFTALIDQLAGANKSMAEIKAEVQDKSIADAIAKDKEEIKELTKAFSNGRTSAEAYALALETVKGYSKTRLMDRNTSANTKMLEAQVEAIQKVQDELAKNVDVSKEQAAINETIIKQERGSIPDMEHAVDLITKRKEETAGLVDIMTKFLGLDLSKADDLFKDKEIIAEPKIIIEPKSIDLTPYQAQLKNMRDQMNGMIEAFLEDTLTTFVDGMTTAALTGTADGWNQFFNTMLSGMGSFLKQMGAMLISYAISMQAFKKAFANPWAALAAGVALVAIGAGITYLAQNAKPQGYANGGIVGGNSYSGDKIPALVNSGEMILNRNQQHRLFNMANGGMGGGMGLTGRLEVEGTKLVALIETVVKKQNSIK